MLVKAANFQCRGFFDRTEKTELSNVLEIFEGRARYWGIKVNRPQYSCRYQVASTFSSNLTGSERGLITCQEREKYTRRVSRNGNL